MQPTTIGFKPRSIVVTKINERAIIVDNTCNNTKLKTTKIIVASKPPVDVVASKSVIPGVIRENIKVSFDELSKRFPSDKMENIKFAIELLGKISLQTMTESQCIRRCENEQKQYTLMIDEFLKYSSSDKIKVNIKYMERFQIIFKDLSDSLLNQNKKVGWLHAKPKTVREKLEEYTPEILQLKNYMSSNAVVLTELLKDITNLINDFSLLLEDLISYSIVDQYLLSILSSMDSRYNVIDQHSRGLIKMISNIQSGDLLRLTTKQTINDLLFQINDVVLSELPCWMEKILFLSKSEFTETECYTLNQKLQTFIQG
jgi:hypothetical protein